MNFKKIPFFLSVLILILPTLFTYFSPANNFIITFMFYMGDTVTSFNSVRIMVYSEYFLLKGSQPKSIQHNIWLISVIGMKIVQMNCYWMVVLSIHIYSPFYNFHIKHRLVFIHSFIVVHVLLEYIYIKKHIKNG